MIARLLLAVLACATLAAQEPAGRTIAVLSDLHMGPGRTADGRWDAAEDFRWADDLTAFLRTLDAQAGGTTDLVLNGDTLEVGDETALDRVLSAHRTELAALGAFARSGANRLVIVPGDRDRLLGSSAPAQRVIDAVGAPADRMTVAAAGHWLSADGAVFAEHGHQAGFNAAWPDAAQLADKVLDRLESRYPTADNIAMLGAGIRYALAADPSSVAADEAAPIVQHLLFNFSWQQFRMELDDGEVQPPTWDVAAARAQGGALLVSSLPDDDPLKTLGQRTAADGRLADAVRALSDAEIVALCDYRAALRRARRRFEPVVSQFAPRGPIVAECPRTPETRGAIYEYFWRSRDEHYRRYVQRIAERLQTPRPPAVFVHGHTHLADRAQSGANLISGGLLTIPMEGFSPVRGALAPVVINGGAWQRTITPAQLERLRADRNLPWDGLLGSLDPEQLAPCYSFVLVPPARDPQPAVRYWRQSADGQWTIGATCGR